MSFLIASGRLPEGTSPLLAIGFGSRAWVMGGFAAWKMFAKPLMVLNADRRGICVERIWAWRKIRKCYSSDRIAKITVNQTKDAEGDPYFEALVILDDGDEVILAESHFQDECNQPVDSLRRALSEVQSSG